MVSARGRTQADFERIRNAVGERVWAALYLGSPTPAQGGLFSQEWFDRHRAPALPEGMATRIVSVDPAETGAGDEAGIIALAITADGRAWVTDDRSGKLQSDQWARRAIILALEIKATELVFEAFTTGPTYERVIRNAWEEIRRDSQVLRAHGGDVGDAAIALARMPGTPKNAVRAINEVDHLAVPDQDEPPFRIKPWRAKGDKTARAAGTRQAASTGRLRIVGTLPVLESQAVSWQQGQSSPDRMDALVNGFERAMQLVGAEAQIATPTQVRTRGQGSFWSSTIG